MNVVIICVLFAVVIAWAAIEEMYAKWRRDRA